MLRATFELPPVGSPAGLGGTFVDDDENLGDRPWCPLVERVRAVAKVLEPGVVECPNATGPPATLLDSAACRWPGGLEGAVGVAVGAL